MVLRCRGPHTKIREVSLLAKDGPQLTASKETRTSILQLEEIEFCHQPE